MENIDLAKQKLNENNQEKVLRIFEKLDENKQENLAKQILDLDFEQINTLYREKDEKFGINEKVEPIAYVDKNKLENEEKQEIENLGKNVIKTGKYAVVTMAGGQGTRLRT